MDDQVEDDSAVYEYRVVLVEKCDAPAGMLGGDWYRYVIRRGTSEIAGARTGSLYTVTQYAEAATDDLNARAARCESTYVMSRRK